MLGTAECDAEAAHHFVEDQRDVVPSRDLPDSSEELRIGRDVRSLDGLHDDAREAIRMTADPGLRLGEIV